MNKNVKYAFIFLTMIILLCAFSNYLTIYELFYYLKIVLKTNLDTVKYDFVTLPSCYHSVTVQIPSRCRYSYRYPQSIIATSPSLTVYQSPSKTTLKTYLNEIYQKYQEKFNSQATLHYIIFICMHLYAFIFICVYV